MLPTRPVPYPPFDGTQPCRELDPELFFPVTSREVYYHQQQTRPACGDCPFLQACRDYAISHNVDGFWGGTTAAERREERRRLGISSIPVVTSDMRMLQQLLSELDDGVTSSEIIAGQVGCSSATVLRHRRRKAAA